MAGRPRRRRIRSRRHCAARAIACGATTSFRRTAPTATSSRSGSARPRRWSSCGRPRPSRRNGCARKPIWRARRERWSRSRSTARFRRCRSTRSSARTSAAGAGDTSNAGWRKVEGSVALLVGGGGEAEAAAETKGKPARRVAICVLPFVNMSGDPEQEYFSDGISEDITTDLSKVSALSIVARNTAFTFKGQTVDVGEVARQLGVTHVLEGSVRKAGDRVRITAQLIDGETGDHVWADRYDRDLTDIFAIQDEISKAIVVGAAGQAAAQGKEGDRAARHVERRGLQPLSDGAAALDQRQRRRRPARRDRRPDVPAGDRDRSRLCPGMGADGARPDRIAFPPFKGRARARVGRTGAGARSEPGRGAVRARLAISRRKTASSTRRTSRSRSPFGSTPRAGK